MSPSCSSCGSEIPEGQGGSCSMCYGDPFYGRDGYYLEWLQRQEEEESREGSTYEYECPDCGSISTFIYLEGNLIQYHCPVCDWII